MHVSLFCLCNHKIGMFGFGTMLQGSNIAGLFYLFFRLCYKVLQWSNTH